jgi:hypothetical protein
MKMKLGSILCAFLLPSLALAAGFEKLGKQPKEIPCSAKGDEISLKVDGQKLRFTVEDFPSVKTEKCAQVTAGGKTFVVFEYLTGPLEDTQSVSRLRIYDVAEVKGQKLVHTRQEEVGEVGDNEYVFTAIWGVDKSDGLPMIRFRHTHRESGEVESDVRVKYTLLDGQPHFVTLFD